MLIKRRSFIKAITIIGIVPKTFIKLLTKKRKLPAVIYGPKVRFDSVNYGVISSLYGTGVSGDDILSGNEESLTFKE